jgi:hypothetical protein
VHLVRLALQIVEEAADAVPLALPVTRPMRRTLQHPLLLRGRQLVPRGVARDARCLCVAQQIVLTLPKRGGLDRLDGTGAQRQLGIGNHQPPVHTNDAPKAAARVAGARRRVERKQRRPRIGVADVALRAVQAGGIPPQGRFSLALGQRIHRHAAAAAAQGNFHRLGHARGVGTAQAKAVRHHVQPPPLAHYLLRLHARVATGREPLLHVLIRRAGREFDGKCHHQPRITRRRRARPQVGHDRLHRVLAHGQRRHPIEQLGPARKQQFQVVVELGHRPDRGARRAHRVGLVDGDRWRHAVDVVHRRAVHAVQKLPRVGRERLDVAALSFGKQRVEHQAGFARPAGAGHHRQLTGADVQVEVAQIVLPRAADADDARWRGRLGIDCASVCTCHDFHRPRPSGWMESPAL